MTPLLLIPGLLCDDALWRDQIDYLSSDRPIRVANTQQDDSIVAMAHRAHAQMQATFPDTPYALAGLSMGGYVALEMWRHYAHSIERLALLDTRASAESARDKRERNKLMQIVEAHDRFAGLSENQLPKYISPHRLNDKALVQRIQKMTLRVGKSVYIQQQKAIIAREDCQDLLPTIDCPTLILCGEADAITPLSAHEAMAKRIPHATLEVIPQCGHLSTMECPEAVNEAMATWLA